MSLDGTPQIAPNSFAGIDLRMLLGAYVAQDGVLGCDGCCYCHHNWGGAQNRTEPLTPLIELPS